MRPIKIVPGSIRDPEMVSRLQGSYKLLGYGGNNKVMGLGQSQPGALTKAERLEAKIQKREARRALYNEQDHRARVGQKHNMLQHHYREQNPF